MTNEEQLKSQAKRIFGPYYLTEDVRARYERDWVRSVQTLGDKWLFAKHAGKLTPKQLAARSEDGTYRVPSRSTDASPRS